MGRFDSNTLFMGILTVAFAIFSVSLLADGIYHTEVEEFGYPIEVVDAAPTGGGEEEATVEPVLPLLASADVSAGESVFRKCSSCHSNDPSGANKTGPGLWEVVNRPIASHPGFGYSSSLTGHAAEAPGWTYEELNGFLWKPKSWVPGTSMGFAGLSSVQDRANVIAYLRTLSESEAPLPTEEEIAALTAEAEGAEAETAEATDAAVAAEDGVAPDEVATDDGVAAEGETEAEAPAEGGEAAVDARAEGDAGQAGTDGAPVATDTVTGQGVDGNEVEGDAPALDGTQAGFGQGNEPLGGEVVDETDGTVEGETATPDASGDAVVEDAAEGTAPATDGAPTEDGFVVVPVEPVTPAQ